jgi:hypothetical protein
MDGDEIVDARERAGDGMVRGAKFKLAHGNTFTPAHSRLAGAWLDLRGWESGRRAVADRRGARRLLGSS